MLQLLSIIGDDIVVASFAFPDCPDPWILGIDVFLLLRKNE